ncbi:unnamed protein product [Protopolystoma xenopodis]|uniref:Secreted protein n=1 Tax=Protopolystoma xenopodis TaxID=117903 RepID=A0A3S5CV17_9PLAT|nr:unnamed protein product [Protopolystoma xenopodis]
MLFLLGVGLTLHVLLRSPNDCSVDAKFALPVDSSSVFSFASSCIWLERSVEHGLQHEKWPSCLAAPSSVQFNCLRGTASLRGIGLETNSKYSGHF